MLNISTTDRQKPNQSQPYAPKSINDKNIALFRSIQKPNQSQPYAPKSINNKNIALVRSVGNQRRIQYLNEQQLPNVVSTQSQSNENNKLTQLNVTDATNIALLKMDGEHKLLQDPPLNNEADLTKEQELRYKQDINQYRVNLDEHSGQEQYKNVISTIEAKKYHRAPELASHYKQNVVKMVSLRGDARSPKEILDAGGFYPLKKTNINYDIEDHTHMVHVERPHCGTFFISTTRSLPVAIRATMDAMDKQSTKRWIYVINTAGFYVDGQELTKKGNRYGADSYHKQAEIAIPGGVPFKEILASRETESGKFTGPINIHNELGADQSYVLNVLNAEDGGDVTADLQRLAGPGDNERGTLNIKYDKTHRVRYDREQTINEYLVDLETKVIEKLAHEKKLKDQAIMELEAEKKREQMIKRIKAQKESGQSAMFKTERVQYKPPTGSRNYHTKKQDSDDSDSQF